MSINIEQAIDLYKKGTITVGNDGKVSLRIEKSQAATCDSLKLIITNYNYSTNGGRTEGLL